VEKRQTDGGEIVEDLLFQMSGRACLCGTAEQLAEKVLNQAKTIPRRLKPNSFCSLDGTAEADALSRRVDSGIRLSE
jgi:hypothetical protein